MLRIHLKTALRSLRKNPTFSTINILGLSIGTLCCLYIVMYVGDQFSYDSQHKNAQNIYRVDSRLGAKGGNLTAIAAASPPIAPALKRDFPEVDQYTRVVPTASFGVKEHLLRYKEKSFNEKEATFVDSTFFDVFNFHFLAGSPLNALREPYSVVLLKPLSDKLFGDEDPLGKVITIDNSFGKHEFTVAGVVDESLGKSQVQANMFLSMNSNGIGALAYSTDRWAGENFAYSFIRLNLHVDPAQFEKRLPAFLQKYAGQQLKELGMQKTLYLQPLRTIHTDTDTKSDMGKTISASFLKMLLLIAILIQVIACINFMNLSTARASSRAMEVGVRKVLGASRQDLIRQFLGESSLLALSGMLIAIPLLVVALPYLDGITGADIHPSLLAEGKVWMAFGGLILITGLLAGSYPAFYLSAFHAIRVIKGNFTSRVSVSGIRRALVVFQFSLSILLITGIVVIFAQLYYIAHKDLGFDQNQKLVFNFRTPAARALMDPFMNEVRQLPEVKSAGKATNYPSQHIANDWSFFLPGGNVNTGLDVPLLFTDDQFRAASGIALLSGRDFRVTDTDKVIINQTLARQLGLDPAAAAGKMIVPLNNPPMEIAGVMKDINYNSLHQEIGPFLLWYAPRGHAGWGAILSDILVNVNTDDYHSLLGKIQTIWQKILPDEPFEYMFLSDQVQQQYESEFTLSRIINTFAVIAVFISCLGLFGLAAFGAEQRIKEIGIRKVLGANVTGIVSLLSADFLKLVGIAFLLAAPISWWMMSRWLDGFIYRTHVSWWMPLLSGSIAFGIALITVSSQAIRAALANPIRSLRTE